MNNYFKKLLLPFYFGSINDQDRLAIEQEMLCNEELLVDYFDLKRTIEIASSVPQLPSPSVFISLKALLPKHKKTWINLSIGAAIAASILLFYTFKITDETYELKSPSAHRKIYDSSSELFLNSTVL